VDATKETGEFVLGAIELEGLQDRMAERSNYQNKVIKNYYDNRENIALQRCQEIVTELYLAEGKKRQRQWDLLATHLEKLEVPQATIEHLRSQNSIEVVANFVTNLSKGR